jgi:hypothetical protein
MGSKRIRDAVGIDPDRVVSAAIDAALGDTHARRKHHPGRVLAAGAALAAAAAVGQKRLPRMAAMPLRMGLHKLGDMAHVDELADALHDRLARHDDAEEDDGYYDDEEEFEDGEDSDGEPRDDAEPEDEDDEFDDEPEEEDEDDEGFDDEPEDDDGPRGEGDALDDDSEDGDETEEDGDAEPDDEEPEEEPEVLEDDGSEQDLEPEHEDEDIAARSVDLGVDREGERSRRRDRAPDLFQALSTPHRRPPVMRRGSRRLDPAARPPEPDHDDPAEARDVSSSSRRRSNPHRSESQRRSPAKNQKSTAARA